MICRVSCIPGGAGFLPSTVWLEYSLTQKVARVDGDPKPGSSFWLDGFFHLKTSSFWLPVEAKANPEKITTCHLWNPVNSEICTNPNRFAGFLSSTVGSVVMMVDSHPKKGCGFVVFQDSILDNVAWTVINFTLVSWCFWFFKGDDKLQKWEWGLFDTVDTVIIREPEPTRISWFMSQGLFGFRNFDD